jgi:hypothetical protein
MKFIGKSPFTIVALATFLISRLCIIKFFGPHISDVYYFIEVADHAIRMGQKAYQDFLWGYPPLSLSIVYAPYYFRDDFDGYRLIFRLANFVIDSALVFYLARFLAERLRLNARAVTVGVCGYSVLSLFQGHLIYERLDVFLALCFVVALFYASDPVLSKAMGAGVIGVLWKVMPVFWMPVLGVMRWFERGSGAFLKSALIAIVPTAIFFIGWDSYVNGHFFTMLNIHNERGIQIESVWASIFMVIKLLNPSAAIEIANNFGAQHLAGADVPQWVVELSRRLGFLVLLGFYAHFARRIWQIKKSERRKTFNYFIGAYFAMSMPFVIFLTTQRVLSTQYFQWILPTVAILFALRPKAIDFILVTAIFALTSVEFDGITWAGQYYGYWNYVKFDPLITIDMAVRNLLLVIFAVRYSVLYVDYFSAVPKYFSPHQERP